MNREDLMDMMMTGDFPDDLRPEEYVIMLGQVRDLYKSLYNDMIGRKREFEDKVRDKQSEKAQVDSELSKLQSICAGLRDENEFLRSPRKLSWRERFTGRINQVQSSS
jgi:hypothetical protein